MASDFDSATSSVDNNPFAAPKSQSASKISVNLTFDNWLCKMFDRQRVKVTSVIRLQGSIAIY